jgi:hypothetical protein
LSWFVKIGFIEAVLHDTLFFEFAFGMSLGDFGADFACILQDFTIGSGDKPVQP